jgi:hypothetical protein
MKLFNLTIIFLTFFSHLYAYDYTIPNTQDKNISYEEYNITNKDTLEPIKNSKSLYRKFKDLFSDYDGDWVEDIATYPIDIMMPDEAIQATEDIIDNRNHQEFSSQAEQIPKQMGNDAYNMVLTTAYYHFQDISRITNEIWEDDACDPDTFEYNTSKDPQQPLLYLKANDENARGVTKNGIVLPVNPNFPDAFYPYASRPDGCSAEGLQDVYDLANDFSNDDEWLEEACNAHDRCYYTEGTSSKECNQKFIVEAVDSCNNISNLDTVFFMGMKNAFCGFKGLTVSSAANACAEKYFAEAQRKQKAYNQWVANYEKAYIKAKRTMMIKLFDK